MATKTIDENTVDARPQHEGHDPLAGGERLHNVSNSSEAQTYEVSQNEADTPRPKSMVADGEKAPMPVMPAHKTKNLSKEKQDAVAAGRVEPNGLDRKTSKN